MRAALGRPPIHGEGSLEPVIVRAVDVPLVDLVMLWFKVAIAAIPVAIVAAVLYAIVRGALHLPIG